MKLLAALLLLLAAAQARAAATPNPELYFSGAHEFYSAGGKNWTRYRFGVQNFAAYSEELFAASPALPPCGTNTKAARTWVDFFDSRGKRLNGFCALGKAADLNMVWFTVEEGVVPPSWVYIELHDRLKNLKYKSNLAETTQ